MAYLLRAEFTTDIGLPPLHARWSPSSNENGSGRLAHDPCHWFDNDVYPILLNFQQTPGDIMKRITMVGMVAAFFIPTGASAQHFQTADALLNSCATEGNPECYQYIVGAHDAVVAAQQIFLTNNRIAAETPAESEKLVHLLIGAGELSCIPAGTTPETLRRSFVSWMIANDSGAFGAGRILMASFAHSFPCSN